MHFKNLVSGLTMLVSMAAMAQAGSMNTFITVANRFDAFFTPLPLVFSSDGVVANGQPGIYQVDVSFTASNDPGDKGWANTLFDVGTTGNLALDLPLGYTSNSNTLDTNGALTGGVKPIYGTNTDGGTAGDLKAIVASIESATITTTANDARNNLGTPQAPAGALNPPDPGTWIGTVYVDWDGTGTGAVVLNNQQFRFSRTDNTFGPFQTGNRAFALFGDDLEFAPVINSLLIVVPTIGLTCTNNCSVSGTVTGSSFARVWSPSGPTLSLASYMPGFGAPPQLPGPVNSAFWDPLTQHFSWDATGSTIGTYVWNVSATNAGGTGNGTITVVLNTPEPATLALAGLGLVGLLGFIRHRPGDCRVH